MKKRTYSILAFILCLSACTSEAPTETGAAANPTEEPTDTTPAAPTQTDNTISYQEQLESGGMRFDIRTTGEGTMRSLAISVERPGLDPVRIDEQLEGTVESTVTTDLNNNKKPELLVFVTGAGTGSYGKLYGYEFDNQYWGALQLPELTEAQSKGYMGHDEFEIKEGRLTRTFPVYLDSDPNSTPSGGFRSIVYSLGNDLHFKVIATNQAAE
ncbi:hypothetical protein [Pontibacter arcticus]|uniref:Lipoprotein n=1 Tax=Pontibacter arcticus TaxID=2080288 RepID=A0A364RI91_9BACT|nr:hypothetical protein [Pontibacter arcticus]RAU84001.1 hypothetical protein DP923_02785 [Pontibacter arcticus]